MSLNAKQFTAFGGHLKYRFDVRIIPEEAGPPGDPN
jgi:hypothetical protein